MSLKPNAELIYFPGKTKKNPNSVTRFNGNRCILLRNLFFFFRTKLIKKEPFFSLFPVRSPARNTLTNLFIFLFQETVKFKRKLKHTNKSWVRFLLIFVCLVLLFGQLPTVLLFRDWLFKYGARRPFGCLRVHVVCSEYAWFPNRRARISGLPRSWHVTQKGTLNRQTTL